MHTVLEIQEIFCDVCEKQRGQTLRALLEQYLRMELESEHEE